MQTCSQTNSRWYIENSVCLYLQMTLIMLTVLNRSFGYLLMALPCASRYAWNYTACDTLDANNKVG